MANINERAELHDAHGVRSSVRLAKPKSPLKVAFV